MEDIKSREHFELRSPKALTDIMMSHITPGTEQVMIADCAMYGDAIFDVLREHPETEFVITTWNRMTEQMIAEYFDPFPNAHLITANLLERRFTDKKFEINSLPEGVFCPATEVRTYIRVRA